MILIYLTELFLLEMKINDCGNQKENVYLTFLHAWLFSVSSWLRENNRTSIQTSYFIGPCNLHYLLFSGIWALLCHHPHCFPSQSQTLFGMGAGRPPITAIARWLFRRENTLDFAGGRGWGRCFKLFLEYTLFFEIGKDHYYDITTIFMFFLSLGLIDLFS